jgi:tight adherence protein C
VTNVLSLFNVLIAAAASVIVIETALRARRRSTSLGRLGRFAPSNVAKGDDERSPAEVQWLGNLLRVLDPTFKDLEKDLSSAGVSRRLTATGLEALRLAIAVLAAVIGGKLFAEMLGGATDGLAGSLAGFTAGLYGTRQLTKVIVKSRRERALSELFFSIDLLIIFLESGQSLVQSLHSLADVGQASMPLTTKEHRKLVADLSRGLAYEKAFSAWATRIGTDEAQDLAAFFTQALVHGVELGPQLRRFADEMMARRLINARESVGMKSARLTVVMIVFFLPAILLLLAGPPVVAILRNVGGMR